MGLLINLQSINWNIHGQIKPALWTGKAYNTYFTTIQEFDKEINIENLNH